MKFSLRLLACVIVLVFCEATILIKFNNKCEEDLSLYRVDEFEQKEFVATIPKHKNYCEMRMSTPAAYQIGLEGKMRAEFVLAFLETGYMINATAGFDLPMKMAPSYYGMNAGKILECLSEDCADAVHENRKTKWSLTEGGQMDIWYCSDTKAPWTLKCTDEIDN